MTKEYKEWGLDELWERFDYRDGRLFHKSRIRGATIGDRAGSSCKNVYWRIKFKQKYCLEHRLIFFMHHGYFPRLVDHISDDLTEWGHKNNAIENLRDATYSQNNQRAASKSTYKGVFYDRNRGKWRASIKNRGKSITIGRYETQIEAAKAYDKMALEIYGSLCDTNLADPDSPWEQRDGSVCGQVVEGGEV